MAIANVLSLKRHFCPNTVSLAALRCWESLPGFDMERPYCPTSVLDNPVLPSAIATDEWERALSADEFELHFQPQYCLRTRQIIGVEALLRWQHPRYGLLAPSHFLAALPRGSARRMVGAWVLRRACQDAVELRRTCPGLRMAVNLFEEQWRAPELAAALMDATGLAGFHVSALELEITEDIDVIGDKSLREAAYMARELGATVGIDDFGTGYTDFAVLNLLSFDTLKFDRTIIERIASPAWANVIAATCRFAAQRGIRVVAEGLADKRTETTAAKLGCDIGQGYLFSRPIRVDAMHALLKANG